MASGASGVDPAMDTSASPRQKRRGVGNTGPAPAPASPGPRRYTPGPAATETEITLAEVGRELRKLEDLGVRPL